MSAYTTIYLEREEAEQRVMQELSKKLANIRDMEDEELEEFLDEFIWGENLENYRIN